MMPFSNIYSKFLINIILPISDKILSTSVAYHYNLIKRLNSFSSYQIIEWQNYNLHKIVNHAYYNTKYYNALFVKNNITPKDIKTVDDLHKIPILTKEIINKNFQDLIPKQIDDINFKKQSTGGSSGMPLKFNIDLDSWSYITANRMIYMEKYGYKYGDKYLAIGSTSLFPTTKKSFLHDIYYSMKNKIGVNGVNMSDDVILDCINLIKKHKIKFLYGYTSSIFLIADFCLKNKIQIDIKSVFTTSETLTEHYEKTIIDAFNCNLVDIYSAHDGGIHAVRTSNSIYEVGYNSFYITKNLNHNIGEILLTNLQNYSLPFLNYDVGDRVKIDNSSTNKKSYNGQTLKRVYGRKSDIINLENGRQLTGPGFTILFKDLNVNAYQISKIGKMKILCKIMINNNFKKQEKDLIVETIKKHSGDDCEIQLEVVKNFQKLKSGKLHYFLSK